ncbi:Acyl-acyl carrier protein thioesterase ATL4, chloroplastic, partial [Cucurbita argyrosperma subsp. argyrosperma]
MTTPKCSPPRTSDLNTNPTIQPSPYRMDGFVDYEMKVRGYELDSSGDRFVLKMRFLDISKARVYLEHKIFKLPNMEAILEAQVTGVWLSKNHRPMRIPQKYLSKLAQFIHDHNQSNRLTVGIKDDDKDGANIQHG